MSSVPTSSIFRPNFRSKYALHLDDSSERMRKKRKRDGGVAPRAQFANQASTSNAPAPNGATQASNATGAGPGLSSGLLQNVNGSEKTGQKAQAEFISKTLSSAAATGGNTSHEQVPQPSNPAETAQQEDTDMNDQPSSEDEVEGETPKETAYLKRLKAIYAKQPDKKAILEVLEGLSREAKEDRRRKKHGKRGPDSDLPWEQDDEYVCTDGPRRREKQRVALSGYIRIILGQYLKLKDKKSPLPYGPPPEVAAPTAASYYVKWDESEKSEFNATAARIVALQVFKDYPDLCGLDELHDMATCHIKYLRARYRRQTIPSYIAKEQQRLLSSSAGTRKRTLYAHRLKIINAVPALARHGRLIEALGLEGTSSDEEDRARKGVYIIKRRKQLSPGVNHLKDQLDQAYSIRFKGPGSKGNQLRKRIDTGLVSNRRLMITGLPVSCMHPAWLATLTDIQKAMYEFRDILYDYSFPEELLESPERL
ncbi:hypothetical protein FRC12_016838 [Ceratobasidium sp. 428]|nr:hypothetical protein FRC12_016838 [Ceratobasidium sp. 428]